MSEQLPPPPGPAQPPPGYSSTFAASDAYPAPRGTNGMAIASLVLGIVWLCGLGSLLAVIFAVSAKKQIKQSGEQGEGLATAGLVLGIIGLVGVALYILALLAIAVLGTEADPTFEPTGSPINRLVLGPG